MIIVQHLAAKGLLDALAHQVRLVRGRFGSYESLDFLARLFGYAISGERTLADFFERLAPFSTAFMALFGRADLPHHSSLSRFLASVDRPCLEAFRQFFEQHSFAQGWTNDSIGGIWDRQSRRYMGLEHGRNQKLEERRKTTSFPCFEKQKRQKRLFKRDISLDIDFFCPGRMLLQRPL